MRNEALLLRRCLQKLNLEGLTDAERLDRIESILRLAINDRLEKATGEAVTDEEVAKIQADFQE